MHRYKIGGRYNITLKALVYASLALAIAFALSYVKLFPMPQGGSVTLMSMFFVSLVGFWFGPVVGLVAGVAYGFLQVVQGAWFIYPAQFLLDYPIAFGLLGLSGFFRNMKGGLYIGFAVGCIGRFASSTIAGWLFWIGFNTPGSLWASMVYNGGYIFTEMVLSLVIISTLPIHHALKHITKRINSI
jgi:thiamine transporter